MAKRSVIVEEMAEAFRTERLVVTDLDRTGICTLGVEYLGERLIVGWYSTGHLRELRYGGSNYVADGEDANFILNAAKARAPGLFAEKIAEIEKRRTERKPD